MRYYTYLIILANMSSGRSHGFLVIDRTSFFKMNRLTRQKLSEIFVLANMSTLIFEMSFSSLLNRIGIISVNGECYTLFLTLNSILIHMILSQIMIVNLVVRFTSRKLWTNISLIWRVVGWSLIAKIRGIHFYWLLLKPLQEDYTDISTFIWMLCVSYSSLNNITRNHIPRYSNSIEDLSDYCSSLSIISLDAHCGCYQVKVRACDQNKLIFSLRTGKNNF